MTSEKPSFAIRGARWAYSMAIRLLPRPFRQRHGQGLQAFFDEQIADTYAARGVRALLQQTLRSLVDVVSTARREGVPRAASDDGILRVVGAWLFEVGRDTRHTIRSLAWNPGFTATVTISLALGIGANTALFSTVNAVSWRVLPVLAPEELVILTQGRGDVVQDGFSYQEFTILHERASQVIDVAASASAPLNVRIGGRQESTASGLLVSGGYFTLLGVPPALGRTIGPGDDGAPGSHPVAMLSHRYWEQAFNRDPAAVGSRIALSGTPFTIVGVTPAGFFGTEVGTAPEIFVPIAMQPVVMPASENLLLNPELYWTWLDVVGRLRPGVPVAVAQAALETVSLERDRRDAPGGSVSVTLTPAPTGTSALRSDLRQAFRALTAVVGVVLLIACVNTGGVVLARADRRRGEFALRSALGADRLRLLRQMVVEGLVLAALGGILGLVVAYAGTKMLFAHYAPANHPAIDLAPDLRVLAFTALVSAVTGLLFATLPAVRASRVGAAAARRDHTVSRRIVGERPRGRGFLACQVALSLLLLMGAGLFIRSLWNLHDRSAQATTQSVLLARVEPRGSNQRGTPGTSARLDAAYRSLIDRVESIPGVQVASMAHTSPLSAITLSSPVTTARGTVRVSVLMVYPKYLATMGLQLVGGRDLDERDASPGSAPVALVNEAFVRQFLPGEPSPVNARVRVGRLNEQVEIVGIVEDAPYPNLREGTQPVMYRTFHQTQTGRGQMVLHVRIAGAAADIAPLVARAVQDVDADVPMYDIYSLQDEFEAVFVQERLIAGLSGGFALIALVLVSVGLYGATSLVVSRRVPEIGLRMALGARRLDVVAALVGRAMRPVIAGIVGGSGAAWLLSLLVTDLRLFLFDVTALDPLTLAGASGVLFLVSLWASWLPVHRAAKADPSSALKAA